MIERIYDPNSKKAIARKILEALKDWFEVDEARERYIAESADRVFLAAKEGDGYAGFLCLKETGRDTVELAVMGVLKEYHRRGIGRKLFEAAKKIAAEEGYAFMQVKTVRMGVYKDYDITNRFYLSCGFKEFEVIRELWGEKNPCQIYVMSLKEQTPQDNAGQRDPAAGKRFPEETVLEGRKYGRIGPERIAELWALQKAYKAEIGEEEPGEQDRARLADAIQRGQIAFYGAWDQAFLVGCCSVTAGFSTFAYARSGVFEDFYIRPEYRHKGIARQLVRYAWRESGVRSMTVGCADCDVPMYRALGFSAALGNLLAYE